MWTGLIRTARDQHIDQVKEKANVEKTEVAERTKKAIAGVLNMNPADISDTDAFVADLGADSMQSVELVAAFEEEFDVEMDEDKALSVENVGGAVTFIAAIVDE